jgi:hypothetical protein
MKVFSAIILVTVGALIVSCEKDQDNENENNVSSNVVIITEDITEPSTWAGDSVYLIKAWDFYVENTLTIKPGCVVKFHPTSGPSMYMSGSGTVIARGTSTNPIIFTSFKDDSRGGDTNEDGDATSPASKDWANISTNGTNGSVFQYC